MKKILAAALALMLALCASAALASDAEIKYTVRSTNDFEVYIPDSAVNVGDTQTATFTVGITIGSTFNEPTKKVVLTAARGGSQLKYDGSTSFALTNSAVTEGMNAKTVTAALSWAKPTGAASDYEVARAGVDDIGNNVTNTITVNITEGDSGTLFAGDYTATIIFTAALES